ncbi:TRAP transporter small permease [Psychromarinibacter sp. C21-152]|uniref:TRAP transporter small permease protein n=1 Tax=Psychromarinibacter sediminicola TaxID=3033385 RepID=A0AAE3NSE1_9RHOB|nr:TRAP transporter small permease [Psychromarinibacter sediminicola]MDF0599687.1 TRAP transporter small permease [Psychromarinibacter sediminicola]
MELFRGVRTILDAIYKAAGVVAALCLVSILGLIVLQMLARWTGMVFIGATDYAGYAMAAASFLAFAYALNHGSHIRVSILLNSVPKRVRWWLEIWCFGIGSAIMWYFAWFGQRFVYWSWKFGDVSQGQDATPLWIPQSVMLAGAVILAIALTDHLVHLIVTGDHRLRRDLVDQSFGE